MQEKRLATIAELSAALARGERSVQAVVGEAAACIRALNPEYRAFSHLDPDADAQLPLLQTELDAGRPRSALHGLAVSIKGNIPVAGMPWTEGSAMHRGRIAERDAAIVSRVRAAGGVIMGTTTLSELAMYGVRNPFEPLGVNPWDPRRTAGGSSTGAGVAAALGMAQVNIGTDSGGSIRNPACHCGVVGFMPRIGALTLEGKPNHAPSLSTLGLIGRRVADVATAYGVLAEPAPPPVLMNAPRLLVMRRLIDTMCDDETLAMFNAALSRLAAAGFSLVEAEVPGWMEGERAAGVVSLAESGAALAHMDLSAASDGIRARAAAASRLDAGMVTAAREAGVRLRRELAVLLRDTGAHAVVTPTWPFAAPGIDDTSVIMRDAVVPVDPHRNCFVRAANAIDACAITLPMGLYAAGVPAGLHLLASGGAERELLVVAVRAEASIPVLPVAPPLKLLRTST
jgi:Asp-tRNA(Asn)/Glu-tRNA(Gln) amidotransferase A subunit family amidase